MSNILKHFESLNSKEWDYYKRDDDIKEELTSNWSCTSKHKDFIEEFLTVAGKKGILNHFDINQVNRVIHTNSVFFIGCLFYKHLELKKYINFKRDDGHEEFHFIWFLASLVHDFGYEIENNFKDCGEKNKNLIQEMQNENNLLNYTKDSNELNDAYNTFSDNVKEVINDIPNYFYAAYAGKRSSSNKQKIEHGIYAGLKLYDALLKNRKIREDNKKNEKPILYWGKDIEKFYAIASFSIAIHNMRRNQIEYCKKNDYKISIDNEPFLFLFSLADTIEPIKTNENTEEILTNIDMKFEKNIIIIEKIKDFDFDFEKYKETIKQLENWLDIDIKPMGTNKIRLKINRNK